MSTTEDKPFSENALRRITQIIVNKYRNQQDENDDIVGLADVYDTFFPGIRSIRNFFNRAGCREDFVDDNGATNSTFLSLAKIQAHPNGKAKLIRIIEQLCDPEEYFDDPENRMNIIKQLNQVLRFYNLKVENGKVAPFTFFDYFTGYKEGYEKTHLNRFKKVRSYRFQSAETSKSIL